MFEYKIITKSSWWSTCSLTQKVELLCEEMEDQGWEVFSVSFGPNVGYACTAFITLRRERSYSGKRHEHQLI